MDTKEQRKYAITRQEPGVYLCPSNDARTLYRFSRYQDGAHHGLDVDYQLRTFWQVERLPFPPGGSLDDLSYAPWELMASMLPTKRAAVAEVFGD